MLHMKPLKVTKDIPTLGLAYIRHLDAPREVQVMFASRSLQEWDPTFIAHVSSDGIVLFKRGQLPPPFAA
jgi:hypothetical protein